MPTLKRTQTKRPWSPERKPHERRNRPNQAFYNSTRWRQFATLHKMQNPFCAMCETGIAEVTDHIRPINEGGAMWDVSNLQSLCRTCHAVKSGKEAHKHG